MSVPNAVFKLRDLAAALAGENEDFHDLAERVVSCRVPDAGEFRVRADALVGDVGMRELHPLYRVAVEVVFPVRSAHEGADRSEGAGTTGPITHEGAKTHVSSR